MAGKLKETKTKRRRTKNVRTERRRRVLDKIAQYEREGRFDEDVEDDPPTVELLPDRIEYLHRGFGARIRSKCAFLTARCFVLFLICKKQLVIRQIEGIEHIRDLSGGAVITCNHFHPYDSFVTQMVYERSGQKKRALYRVIREGNYTSFHGLYGFLMRNCNTLPLSSNYETMKKFIRAVDTLLCQGNFVLVYPEQSMWWNYRKPKPLKNGAFKFAAKNGVPVVPCFVTMEDAERLDGDGFLVQEYTAHVTEPIYPDAEKTVAENVKRMREENFAAWKKIYEETYGIPLEYG